MSDRKIDFETFKFTHRKIFLELVRERGLRRIYDSPIECDFAAAVSWFYLATGFKAPFQCQSNRYQKQPLPCLLSQHAMGDHIFDFLLSIDGDTGHGILIECDGHDYHERTKEQAAHDRSIDVSCAAIGLPLLRFTGSQIFADVHRCAAAALIAAQSYRTRLSLIEKGKAA